METIHKLYFNNLKTNEKPKVSICIPTYNHDKFIKKTIESILIQKVDFKVEIVVHDDASTDNSQIILKYYKKRYPSLIRLILQKENQLSKYGRVILQNFLAPNTRGKYLAICDGDDFWTDTLKLKKQADFLDNNPDCGMIYTKVKRFNIDEDRFTYRQFGGPYISFYDLLTKSNRIPTLTALFKKKIFKEYIRDIKPEKQNWLMGDYPLWLYIALNGKIHFLKESTGVYRMGQNTLSNPLNWEKREAFIRSTFDIKRFFLEYSKIKYSETSLCDSEYFELASNAVIYSKNILSKYFIKKIKNKVIKHKILTIIINSFFLTILYRKIKRLR